MCTHLYTKYTICRAVKQQLCVVAHLRMHTCVSLKVTEVNSGLRSSMTDLTSHLEKTFEVLEVYALAKQKCQRWPAKLIFFLEVVTIGIFSVHHCNSQSSILLLFRFFITPTPGLILKSTVGNLVLDEETAEQCIDFPFYSHF